MIRSYRSEDTQALYVDLRPVRVFRSFSRQALRRLQQLDSATSLGDLKLPGNHLEKLRGNRLGQHSIRINDQWRICFRWNNGDAYDVEIVDYH